MQVKLDNGVSSTGFKALSKLRRLRYFLFGARGVRHKDHEQKCLLMCAQYMPRLKVAGRHFEFLSVARKWGDYHNKVVNLRQPIKLCLQHLVVDCLPVKHINTQVQFPNVEALSLSYLTTVKHISVRKFPSLSQLGLYETDPATVMAVLQKVGKHLHSLVLDEIDGIQMFSLHMVLQLCPHLKRFRVAFCQLDDALVVWPEGYFSCMEEVCLLFNFHEDYPDYHCFIVQVISMQSKY